MKEKIASVLVRLHTERKTVAGELASMRSSNAAAWATYGSELCAGEMLRDERRLDERITTIDGDIKLITAMQDGQLTLGDDTLGGLTKEIRDKIDGMKKEIVRLTPLVADLERFRRLLDMP